jgi:hypothetical protein
MRANRTNPIRDMRVRDELLAREAAENGGAVARARHEGKNVTFIAHDGCEVTVTPSGHVFQNMSDWY